MTMPANITRPWKPRELLKFNGYRLWYYANALGVIEHVYLPGGKRLSYDELIGLSGRINATMMYPVEVREP